MTDDKIFPAPIDFPKGKVLTCDSPASGAHAVKRLIQAGSSPRTGQAVEMIWSSPGFEPAGSICRWTNGYYSCRTHDGRAWHGQQFSNDAEGETAARIMFDKRTNDTASLAAPLVAG